ncbi:MAG: bifunctional [glutamate--ammonia ligase]-adenylyl-L-tyrosine phosphorylase/[glutamate--ammonia-ligase] adenylyltransferase, partial [Gammaproteobacteria bacterium]|nr:bifunctional [glutamate--ammonia ligase]-adenylyl-L-tyrosine phosphorylase/[glutamate--ammonia-ligase] adenylyltransferase [Gammaproteobacteria bacterium]
MIRIAWRDLAGWSDLTHTMQELSELADACIDSSATILHRWQCEQWGTPRDAQYNMLPLIVVALGKLGAQELNFSSDVDLLFCYAKEGDITEQQSISHQQFFHRLGCQLMKVLHQTTCDGFVFRVDMRLRPYGDSGALVNSFATLKDYYQHSGRDWERYALIKARIISGYDHSSKRLLAIIRSFVYRRYIDFGMVEALRQLQQLISQEVRKKSLENNVKRGSGGIREIEFIGQTFKLIRGGLRVRLQERNTLSTLILLREMDCLSENIVEQLTKAYYFLRNIENRLQMYADQQTQTLPTETQQQISLVLAMKMDSWQQLLKELHQHTQIVHQTFTALIAKPNLQLDNPEADATFKMLQACWQQTLNKQQTIDFFTQQNIIQAEACWQILLTLHNHKPYQTLSAIAHQHLDSIMPRLLQISLQHENAYTVITRIITVIEALLREYNYLALLAENPIALSQLVKLCAASPWITLQIAHIPSLLDELLEPNNLYAPPDLATLKNHLQHYLLSIPEDDIEEQMHALRSFKQAHVLRVAAAEVTDALPLMKVSDYLTNIASIIVNQVLRLAWHELTKRHGYPLEHDEDSPINFIIIAYGKLGGIELGYGSDLDLVFLYQTIDNEELTSGMEPISQELFYSRLGQQLINLLGAHSKFGRLYEVDMRLRPSGSSGLLVHHIDAFADYQYNQAWPWEHQALVRARCIAGNKKLGEKFLLLRQHVLKQIYNEQALQQHVRDMRKKMRAAVKENYALQFDLKQGLGGIADIEFLVQYSVLRWAHQYPNLLEWTDNIRILENLAIAGLLHADKVKLLSDAYRAYRAAQHRLDLQNRPNWVNDDQFMKYRENVQAIFNDTIGG